MKIRSELGRSLTVIGVGAMVFGLSNVWLLSQSPASARGPAVNPTPGPGPASAAETTKPIYFTFGFHWDNPERRTGNEPVRNSLAVRRMTDLLERRGIRAHYGFVGVVAQQLAEDFPETVAKMRKLKIAVGYHGGAGHNPRGPHRQQPDIRGLSPEEAIRALWTFETCALYPDDHPQAGQPIAHVPGGWLAIQTALGVTPLQTDAAGRGALYESLGAGYPMSLDESSPQRGALPLPELHEIHAYGEGRGGGVPATYYGRPPGEFAPVTVDLLEWFRILADNLPRNRVFASGFMSHAGIDWNAFERLLNFLKSRDDFRITAPDPEGWQWEPKSDPLVFYQRRYGVKSLQEVMNLTPPLEELRPRFKDETTDLGWRGRPRMEGGGRMTRDGISPQATRHSSLSREDILLAADYVLSHWPRYTHDGDFGGPPAFVELDPKRTASLADAFQAFVRAIDEWRKTGKLPESVAPKPLRGPIDFPTHKLDAPQTLDHRQRLLGYTPREIPREAMPDASVVERQGLPACGDFHIWIQTHTKADAADVIAAVKRVAETMTDHVPGFIPINLLCHTRRGQPDAKREVAVNPAEFLYALAQQYRALATRGEPNDVVLVSMKVTAQQVCRLLLPRGGNRFEGFIHRAYLSPGELDAAWTQQRRN
ncbi:MAG: hypothetical protein HY735_10460 [Verrucomicrobia bacterium]|nr:hypothetical protein [Verrucomicrobiota bacterium]